MKDLEDATGGLDPEILPIRSRRRPSSTEQPSTHRPKELGVLSQSTKSIAPALSERWSMHLTAIVCTYNRYDLLSDVIDSLVAQVKVVSFDVIVVDNSPGEPQAREFAFKYRSNDRLSFIHEAKPGLSHARNVGARAARGDILAYIDDDALASPTWAHSILEGFASFENVGVVGGVIEPLWSIPRPKWLSQRALDMLSLVDRGPVLREMEPHEWLAGCNIAFRKDLLLAMGGFQTHLGRKGTEALLLSNEEYVVCERLMEAGFKMVYSPEAHVRHRIPANRISPRWLAKRMAWQAISDAVSHPSRSAYHSCSLAETKHLVSRSARLIRKLRFFWIMNGWARSISDEDLELVYDTFNMFICRR